MTMQMEKFKFIRYTEIPKKHVLQKQQKELKEAGFNISYAELKKQQAYDAGAEVWENNIYLVLKKDANKSNMHLNTQAPDAWYLSIRRIDQKPIWSWRDLQQIKNELIGEENEGFMLYPRESRVVDTANQYHLFVFKEKQAVMPYGFNNGRVITNKNPLTGGKQEPRKKMSNG